MTMTLSERIEARIKKRVEEIIKNISIKIEEKLRPLREENQALKSEIENQEKRIEYLERDNKKKNIIMFGFEENETCVGELSKAIREKIRDDLRMCLFDIDISNVYRVGKRNKNSNKPRPVVVTFVHKWKRNEVLRNKKRFRNVFVSEDFPKNVVEKRRLWLAELKEERKKGKIAYLVYDKLLVKPGIYQNKKEEEVDEDLSELLDAIEQCEQQQEEKKPRRRRGKALININKDLSDEDKENAEEKPRRRATATITKKNKSSDKESVGKRALENLSRRASTSNNKKVNFSNEDSEEDDEKPKPRANKLNNIKDSLSNEDYEKDINKDLSDEDQENAEEKLRRRATATITKTNKSSDEESVGKRALENIRRRASTLNNKKVNFSNEDSEDDDDEKPKPRANKLNNKKDSFSNEDYEKDNGGAIKKIAAGKKYAFTEYVPHKRKIDY